MRLIDGGALSRTMCGKQCGCEPEECGYEVGNRCPWRNEIDAAPTIDPVRHAHWKATSAGMAICSACDEDQEVETFVGNAVQKYCARCGARMDAEEENDG